MFKPKTFYYHKATKNSDLYNHIIKSNPQLTKFVEITTNTQVTDESYGLISTKPEDFYTEKSTKIALLNRNAKWGTDPNGRSDKNDLKKLMTNMINIKTPYSRIRYMF